MNLFCSVTIEKMPFVEPEPTKEQSVRGMAFGSVITLSVVGI